MLRISILEAKVKSTIPDKLMSTKLIAVTFILIISSVPFPLGHALAVSQRRSMIRPSRAQLAEVESGCFKGVLNSVALQIPLLTYPREAARQGIGGKVTIKVFVNEIGTVYHASAIDGPPILRKAALRSARGSRFAPFTRDDQPIKCTGLLIYTFNPGDHDFKEPRGRKRNGQNASFLSGA